jgi:CheY-like chemotaxis protein
MKVLIVDDHAGVRDMIRRSFTTAAHQVMECGSGEDAVILAGEFRPDCITMDIRLPGMSGLKAARMILAAGSCRRIVVVSTYDQPELRKAVFEAGAAAFVDKANLAELHSLLAIDRRGEK